MNEIIFIVEDSPEGGFTARSLSHSIYTDADTIAELHANVRDAIACHFAAILIMTTTYPISSLGGRIIRLSSLQDQLSNIKLMRCSQLSKQK